MTTPRFPNFERGPEVSTEPSAADEFVERWAGSDESQEIVKNDLFWQINNGDMTPEQGKQVASALGLTLEVEQIN